MWGSDLRGSRLSIDGILKGHKVYVFTGVQSQLTGPLCSKGDKHITWRPSSHNKRGSVGASDSDFHHRHGRSGCRRVSVFKTPIL